MGVRLDGSRGGGVSRLEANEGTTGRRRRTKAEGARIVAESLVPGLSVSDAARRHGTTRWPVCDWRRKLRTGQLVMPGSVVALPIFAELVVEGAAGQAPAARPGVEVEIAVGDAVIRAGSGVDEGLLTRVIRAGRAATT